MFIPEKKRGSEDISLVGKEWLERATLLAAAGEFVDTGATRIPGWPTITDIKTFNAAMADLEGKNAEGHLRVMGIENTHHRYLVGGALIVYDPLLEREILLAESITPAMAFSASGFMTLTHAEGPIVIMPEYFDHIDRKLEALLKPCYCGGISSPLAAILAPFIQTARNAQGWKNFREDKILLLRFAGLLQSLLYVLQRLFVRAVDAESYESLESGLPVACVQQAVMEKLLKAKENHADTLRALLALYLGEGIRQDYTVKAAWLGSLQLDDAKTITMRACLLWPDLITEKERLPLSELEDHFYPVMPRISLLGYYAHGVPVRVNSRQARCYQKPESERQIRDSLATLRKAASAAGKPERGALADRLALDAERHPVLKGFMETADPDDLLAIDSLNLDEARFILSAILKRDQERLYYPAIDFDDSPEWSDLRSDMLSCFIGRKTVAFGRFLIRLGGQGFRFSLTYSPMVCDSDAYSCLVPQLRSIKENDGLDASVPVYFKFERLGVFPDPVAARTLLRYAHSCIKTHQAIVDEYRKLHPPVPAIARAELEAYLEPMRVLSLEEAVGA